MNKEYIEIDNTEKTTKVSKAVTDKFKKDCEADIKKVVEEINKLFIGKEFSNVGDFWKDNFSTKRGSWSFIKNQIESYGYKFNSKDKEFQIDLNIKSNNQIENYKGSDIINSILATKKKDNLNSDNFIAKTVKVDKNVWEDFKTFCKGYEMSQEKILTLALVELMNKVNNTNEGV